MFGFVTSVPANTARLGRVELTALLALSMALAALAIDMMLPAFGVMRADLGLPADSTALAGAVTFYLLGLAIAQLIYGPMADRFGRKPTLYVGYGIYMIGAAASALAPGLVALLVARFIWGLGAAGPRVVTLSVVRDRYEGEEMSRAMSFIMAVFVLVPIIAPSLGSALVTVVSWRWVFGAPLLLAVVMAIWATRLGESLDPANRIEFRLRPILAAGRVVVSNRQTVGYTIALTSLMGVFSSYLASSELIFSDVFGQRERFPVLFGSLAAVMGGAMLANAFVVRRFGARRLAHAVVLLYVAASAGFLGLVLVQDGHPPLWLFMAGMGVMMGAHSLLIPNFNTIAMDPMKRVAGTAAAVIGTVSTAGGALLGSILDRLFNGTAIPMVAGFAVGGIVALLGVLWAEHGVMFKPLRPVPAT